MNQVETRPHNTLTEDEKGLKSKKTLAGIIYIIQILAFATGGITLIIAAIINYLKRSEIKGTWLESHFDWQLRTSLIALSLTILGAITWQIVIGYILLVFVAFWLVYRIIRGWLRLNAGQPMKKEVI